jgi:TetR/AcrR family transcriptional repressor of nem operon
MVMARASLKDVIKEAGQAEFHEHGYSATGIAAITSRAEAPKGSFYNHFASKEELAVEAVREYALSQRMDLLQDASLPPLDRIRAHFEAIAATLQACPVIYGCMVANFAAELSAETPLLRNQVADIYQLWSQFIVADLQEAASAAGRADFDAEGTAWTLLDSYEGAAVRARATGSGAPLENFLRTTMPLMLSAVTGTG